eukprot:CAMPEP_0167753752 /NCGR_PEP_ID=MMETSP0110_2-20121227/7889_1 /TAXON_ID=629695 /ORGANISM="Gymnochlora sp., Strain CCMP2014" /LENGTH=190 /DNA_ID=CAMNT_0007639555 /DNA_START=1164 /DNA_END=1733 /DNA_ORIENTATION=-
MRKKLDSREWNDYQVLVQGLKVKKRLSVMEREFEEKLKAEVKKLMEECAGMEKKLKFLAEMNAKKIRNEIINLACPSCKMAYIDHEGCMAIRCNHCTRYFCGWCHKGFDGSTACHNHVRACPYNLTPDGNFYCSDDSMLKEGRQRYRTRTLKKYLMQLKKNVRNATVIEIKRELSDLNISPEALYEFGSA